MALTQRLLMAHDGVMTTTQTTTNDHTEAEEAECIASMVPPPRIEQYAGSWYPLVDGRRAGFGWADPEDALAAYEREVAPCTFLATAFVRRPEARHG